MSAKDILIVDDRPANIGFVRDYLKSCGYQVRTALSGQEALDSMAATTPDMVLLDLEMPGMSGLEVLEHIRTSDTLGSVPVVILSAHPRFEVERDCLAGGANEVVEKPLRLRQLGELLTSMIG